MKNKKFKEEVEKRNVEINVFYKKNNKINSEVLKHTKFEEALKKGNTWNKLKRIAQIGISTYYSSELEGVNKEKGDTIEINSLFTQELQDFSKKYNLANSSRYLICDGSNKLQIYKKSEIKYIIKKVNKTAVAANKNTLDKTDLFIIKNAGFSNKTLILDAFQKNSELAATNNLTLITFNKKKYLVYYNKLVVYKENGEFKLNIFIDNFYKKEHLLDILLPRFESTDYEKISFANEADLSLVDNFTINNSNFYNDLIKNKQKVLDNVISVEEEMYVPKAEMILEDLVFKYVSLVNTLHVNANLESEGIDCNWYTLASQLRFEEHLKYCVKLKKLDLPNNYPSVEETVKFQMFNLFGIINVKSRIDSPYGVTEMVKSFMRNEIKNNDIKKEFSLSQDLQDSEETRASAELILWPTKQFINPFKEVNNYTAWIGAENNMASMLTNFTNFFEYKNYGDFSITSIVNKTIYRYLIELANIFGVNLNLDNYRELKNFISSEYKYLQDCCDLTKRFNKHYFGIELENYNFLQSEVRPLLDKVIEFTERVKAGNVTEIDKLILNKFKNPSQFHFENVGESKLSSSTVFNDIDLKSKRYKALSIPMDKDLTLTELNNNNLSETKHTYSKEASYKNYSPYVNKNIIYNIENEDKTKGKLKWDGAILKPGYISNLSEAKEGFGFYTRKVPFSFLPSNRLLDHGKENTYVEKVAQNKIIKDNTYHADQYKSEEKAKESILAALILEYEHFIKDILFKDYSPVDGLVPDNLASFKNLNRLELYKYDLSEIKYMREIMVAKSSSKIISINSGKNNYVSNYYKHPFIALHSFFNTVNFSNYAVNRLKGGRIADFTEEEKNQFSLKSAPYPVTSLVSSINTSNKNSFQYNFKRKADSSVSNYEKNKVNYLNNNAKGRLAGIAGTNKLVEYSYKNYSTYNSPNILYIKDKEKNVIFESPNYLKVAQQLITKKPFANSSLQFVADHTLKLVELMLISGATFKEINKLIFSPFLNILEELSAKEKNLNKEITTYKNKNYFTNYSNFESTCKNNLNFLLEESHCGLEKDIEKFSPVYKVPSQFQRGAYNLEYNVDCLVYDSIYLNRFKEIKEMKKEKTDTRYFLLGYSLLTKLK